MLNAPESLSFQRISTVLPSEQVGDVIKAARGLGVSDTADFPGLVINDPFGLPQKAVVVDVVGLNELPLNEENVSYKIEGKSVSASLDDLKLTSTEDPSDCDINISSVQENVRTLLLNLNVLNKLFYIKFIPGIKQLRFNL